MNISKIDLEKWGVISLLVLWVSTTFSIALMEISTVTALVFWVLYRIREKKPFAFFDKRGICPSQLWIPLALFFLTVLISFCFTQYPKESFRGILKIAKPILVFFVVADFFRNKANARKWDLVFLMTFLLVIVDCSIQYVFGKDILRGFQAYESSAGRRLVGPFGDFTIMGSYLNLVIPIFVMRALIDWKIYKRHKDAFFAIALAIAGLFLIYLTRSRGAFLAFFIAVFFLLVYKRWFKILGFAVFFLLAVVIVVPRSTIIHEDAQGKEQSLVERVELWKRAMNVIAAKPWHGTGINTYNVAHEKYDMEHSWRVRGYYAHNGYLQLAAEVGFPGILFFLIFLLIYFIRGLRTASSVKGSPEEYMQIGILTGLFAFLIYALSDTNLQSPQSLMAFWFMAGILLSQSNAIDSGVESNKKEGL